MLSVSTAGVLLELTLPSPLVLGLLLILGLAYAAALDRRTAYLDVASPRVPQWMRPAPFDLRREFLTNLRLRTSVLRIMHVYPSHTLYTRAQLLHVLATGLALNVQLSA